MLEFGDPRLPGRFWKKVHIEPNSGCWLWSGSVTPLGYGQFWLSKLRLCSRVVMEAVAGPLRTEQYVCHKCDTPNCCNPEHLWVGTQIENVRDCYSKGRQPATRRKKSVCKRGHALTADNVRRGQCHECKKYRDRIEYRKEKAA